MAARLSAGLNPTRVKSVARTVGVEVESDAMAGLTQFADLFFKWNARINLGAIRTAEELIDRHLIDAFAVARFVTPASRLVDVGSGGGLPGIPLALLRPDVEFDLFEPTAKKVAFLRTCIRELGMGGRVRVHASRVEAPYPTDLLGRFDLAMSRAAFIPADWLKIGLALVRPPGGKVVVFGGGASVDLPPAEGEYVYGSGRRILIFAR